MARVLVVDDDAAIRSLLTIVIGREGHTVDTAADGLSALDLLGSTRYELALIDLMMPRLNGYDLLRELETYADAPTVVIVTAMDDRHVLGINSKPVHSILRKPFDVEAVGALINDVIDALRSRKSQATAESPPRSCATAPAESAARSEPRA